MPKFVLRCKANHNHFLEDQRGNENDEEITFTNNIDYALEIGQHVPDFESAELHFTANYTKLAQSLFEVYEVSDTYTIKVVGSELYLFTSESIRFTPGLFTIDICDAYTGPFSVLESRFKELQKQIPNVQIELVKL